MIDEKIEDFISSENLEERLKTAYNDLCIGVFGPAIGNWKPHKDYENVIFRKEILENKVKFDIEVIPLEPSERKEYLEYNTHDYYCLYVPKEYILEKEKYLKKVKLESLKGKVWADINCLRMSIKDISKRIDDLQSYINNINEIISNNE